MKTPIKIGLMFPKKLLSNSISIALEQVSPIKIIFNTTNIKGLLRELGSRTIKPNILLLNFQMPFYKNTEIIKRIKRSYESIKIIIIGGERYGSKIIELLNIGLSTLIQHDSSINELQRAVIEVHKHGFYYTPGILSLLRENLNKKTIFSNSPRTPNPLITNREREVLNLICKQYTTSEIAKTLYISTRTVEGHRKNLLRKTGSKNIVGLVLYACRNGVVSLGLSSSKVIGHR